MEGEIKTKICIKCGEEKLATVKYFYANKSMKDGILSKCKHCKIEEVKEYRLRNIEKVRKTKREYYKANKEEIKAKSIRYSKENRKLISENKKIYYKANKEKIKELNREYRKNNACIIKERKRIYAEKNKEKIKEYKRIYYQKNRDVLDEMARGWAAKHPIKRREINRKYKERNREKIRRDAREQVMRLHDPYIKERIKRQFGLPFSEITPEFIQAKKEQLQNCRELRDLKKV